MLVMPTLPRRVGKGYSARARQCPFDEGGNGTILGQRSYQLIRQPKLIVDRESAIEFLDRGVEAYAFTLSGGDSGRR